jgi:hypothetical protein
MSALCPNCEAEVEATAPSCPKCGAKFGAEGWRPLDPQEQTSGGAAETWVMVAGAAGLVAWIYAAGKATIESFKETNSLEIFRWFFTRELHLGRISLVLAVGSILAAVVALIMSKGKLRPWTGLVSGGLFLITWYHFTH